MMRIAQCCVAVPATPVPSGVVRVMERPEAGDAYIKP